MKTVQKKLNKAVREALNQPATFRLSTFQAPADTGLLEFLKLSRATVSLSVFETQPNPGILEFAKRLRGLSEDPSI